MAPEHRRVIIVGSGPAGKFLSKINMIACTNVLIYNNN
jgi:hypothetical protein